MSSGAIERPRLLRLLLLSVVVSLLISAAYGWMVWMPSAPDTRESILLQPSPKPSGSQILTVLPDRGEPRTARLLHIEQVVEGLRRQSPVNLHQLATTLVSLGEVHLELEHYGAVQRAVDEVAALVESSDAWQRREAGLLQSLLQQRERQASAEHADTETAISLRVEALKLHSDGRYLDAVGRAREVVSCYRRLLSKAIGSPAGPAIEAQLADALLLLGRLMLEHGDTYLEARGPLQEARERCVKVRGESHPVYADILGTLATIDEGKGDFDAADQLYNRALELLRATVGEQSLLYARTLAWQGRMHLDWWEEYAAGKGYRALQIREQLLGNDTLESAESLEHLGMSAFWLFNFEKAETLLNKAIAIRTREQGPQHPELAVAFNWLALVHMYRGDIAQASLSQTQAVSLTVQYRGETHPQLIRYLSTMAVIGSHDWNPTRGEREGRKALHIAATMGVKTHPSALEARQSVSRLMLEEESPYGIAQLIRRKPQDIAAFLRESISLHETNPRLQQLPSYAAAMIGLADAGYWEEYTSITREEASGWLDKAEANIRHHGMDSHPYYADYLFFRGRWHLWIGDYSTARQLCRQCITEIENDLGLVESDYRGGAWRGLAGMYIHEGLPSEEAAQCLRTVAELHDAIFLRCATGQSDIDRMSLARARFYSLGTGLLNPLSGMSAEEQYERILLAKGETSQIQLNERVCLSRPDFNDGFASVKAARLAMKRIAFARAETPEGYKSWQEAMYQAADDKERAERELAIQLRGLHPQLEPLTADQVRASFPTGTVLLDFVQYTDLGPPVGGRGRLLRTPMIGVFIVVPGRHVEYLRLGTVADIESKVAAWLKALQSAPPDGLSLESLSEDVAAAVWRPIVSRLEHVDQIIVAPDGPICFLPFAALPGKTPGRYLIEDLRIGYIPSARQWCELQNRKDPIARDSLLAVGAIDYAVPSTSTMHVSSAAHRALLPNGHSWDNLPATEVEIQRARELFEQSGRPASTVQVLSGRMATQLQLEASLKEGVRYFHFAGHGLFADWTMPGTANKTDTLEGSDWAYATNSESVLLGRAPLLLSGLILSAPDGGSPQSGDAILTAEDVSSLDLRGTEMVVLSACETGLGRTAGGEGVMGLQRAFFNAGVRSAVTSLWKVSDAATGLLMERFYHHLWIDRESKWDALRHAQLDLLNHPDDVNSLEAVLVSRGIKTGRTVPLVSAAPGVQESEPRAHPALWAAFVLYGDGR